MKKRPKATLTPRQTALLQQACLLMPHFLRHGDMPEFFSVTPDQVERVAHEYEVIATLIKAPRPVASKGTYYPKEIQ